MPDRVRMRTLDIDITSHCNLSCRGCNHFSPYAEPQSVSVEAFERQVRTLALHLHPVVFKFAGGEPLLHPDVVALARAARRANLGREIWLVTNGLLLAQQPDDLWRGFDRIIISYYPVVQERLDLRALGSKARAFGVRLQVADRQQFMEPALHFPNDDASLVRRIFRACAAVRHCPLVWNGRLFACCVAPGMDRLLRRLSEPAEITERDGLLIEDTPDFAARIRAQLRPVEPLAACRWCLGCHGRGIAHGQLTADDRRAPTRLIRVEEALDWPRLRRDERVILLGRIARGLVPSALRKRLAPAYRRFLRGRPRRSDVE